MLGMTARVRTPVSGVMLSINVLSLDAQHNSQTFCMEVVQFSGVTAVHSP